MSFFDIKNWWNGKTNFCDNVILYIWGKVSNCVTLNAWHGPVLLYSCHFGFVIFFHNTDHDHRCQVRNFVANCGIGSRWSWNWPSTTCGGSTGCTSSTSSNGSTVGVGERIKSKRTRGRTKGNPAQMPWSTKSETESYLLLQHNHYSTINPRWPSIDCNWDFLVLEIVQVCTHFVSCNKSLIFYRCVFYFLSDWIDCYLLVCV